MKTWHSQHYAINYSNVTNMNENMKEDNALVYDEFWQVVRFMAILIINQSKHFCKQRGSVQRSYFL